MILVFSPLLPAAPIWRGYMSLAAYLPPPSSDVIMPDTAQRGNIILPTIVQGSQATYETLRNFITSKLIPLTTERATPNWGKEGAAPAWWLEDVPYRNLAQGDPRGGKSSDHQCSTTSLLKQLVYACYKHYAQLEKIDGKFYFRFESSWGEVFFISMYHCQAEDDKVQSDDECAYMYG